MDSGRDRRGGALRICFVCNLLGGLLRWGHAADSAPPARFTTAVSTGYRGTLTPPLGVTGLSPLPYGRPVAYLK
jgi:hypothetical protein